jgi:hypothetical protein
MGITSLPPHLLLIIHSVLCVRPVSIHNQHYRILEMNFTFSEEVKEDTDWKNFLNTTKLFQEIKHEFLYLSLSTSWSKEFLTNRFFRGFLRKDYLKNPREQLALYVSESVASFTNLNNLHFVMLSNINNSC